MNVCPKCNRVLEDGNKFCVGCGTPIAVSVVPQPPVTEPEATFEPAPAAPVIPEPAIDPSAQYAPAQSFNPNAQYVPAQNFDPNAQYVPAQNFDPNAQYLPVQTAPKKKFKLSKKLIAFGSAAIALVLVAVIVLTMFMGSGSSPSYLLYLKEGELMYTDPSDIEPWQVTKRLFNSEASDSEIAQAGPGSFVRVSGDGRTIFFADKIEAYEGGFTLYYRTVNNSKKEAEKIDSGVSNYSISESGKSLIYLKKGGNLYYHDLKDKEKIAGDVSGFLCSADAKNIVYATSEGNFYFKTIGKDKEKIDSAVTLRYISEDFKMVYYTKEGSLYKKESGKEREKILSDVKNVISVYETGEIYYTKDDSEEIDLMDYVEDDMADSDAAMTEPVAPDRPLYSEYEDIDLYNIAIKAYYEELDAYNDARNSWNEKLSRDRLRTEIAEMTSQNKSSVLYYYDGKKEVEISDGYADYENYSINTPAMVFSVYEQAEVEKVKLSEISSAYEVEEKVSAARRASKEFYVAVKNTAEIIEQENADEFRMDYDGKDIYYIDNINDDEGDLCHISISEGKIGSPEVYDTSVSTQKVYLYENGKIAYFKEYDSEENIGDLYISKACVDFEVKAFEYNVDSDTVYYAVDYSEKSKSATLKVYKDKESETISDDVYNYVVLSGGELAFLYDYSTNSYTGTLYVYDGGKEPEKVDDDVNAIVPTYSYNAFLNRLG